MRRHGARSDRALRARPTARPPSPHRRETSPRARGGRPVRGPGDQAGAGAARTRRPLHDDGAPAASAGRRRVAARPGSRARPRAGGAAVAVRGGGRGGSAHHPHDRRRARPCRLAARAHRRGCRARRRRSARRRRAQSGARPGSTRRRARPGSTRRRARPGRDRCHCHEPARASSGPDRRRRRLAPLPAHRARGRGHPALLVPGDRSAATQRRRGGSALANPANAVEPGGAGLPRGVRLLLPAGRPGGLRPGLPWSDMGAVDDRRPHRDPLHVGTCRDGGGTQDPLPASRSADHARHLPGPLRVLLDQGAQLPAGGDRGRRGDDRGQRRARGPALVARAADRSGPGPDLRRPRPQPCDG